MTKLMDYGAAMKRMRERAGLTQRELAQKVGVTHVCICTVERAKNYPSFQLIHAVCEVFDEPPIAFFNLAAELAVWPKK